MGSTLASMKDRQHLRTQQYATTTHLDARIALHRRFDTGHQDWFAWVFDQLPGRGVERVLDLGCGNGDLWLRNRERVPQNWRVLVGDLSRGMVSSSLRALGETGSPRGIELDAGRLPLAERSIDLVIANHMLYHLPDIDGGLREIARVLVPGGTLVATTNSTEGFRELRHLVRRVDPESPYLAGPERPEERFGLASGRAQLEAVFDSVEVRVLDGALEVTEAEALVAYLESWETPQGPSLRKGFREAFREAIEEEIHRRGCFRITKQVGAFLAR